MTIEGGNITIKNLTFINGEKGIHFTKKATGKLIGVNAWNNIDGLVFDQHSNVKMDNVNASNNYTNGIVISTGARVKAIPLRPSKIQSSIKLRNNLDELKSDLLQAKSAIFSPKSTVKASSSTFLI